MEPDMVDVCIGLCYKTVRRFRESCTICTNGISSLCFSGQQTERHKQHTIRKRIGAIVSHFCCKWCESDNIDDRYSAVHIYGFGYQ